MKYFNNSLMKLLALFVIGMICRQLQAAQLKILFPLERIAYQTNEQIDISVVRTDTQVLPAGDLLLIITGDNGSKLSFTFPLNTAPLTGAVASTTEHYHLNGWLLRPGNYTVEISADGTNAKASFEIYTHLRRSSYRLIDFISQANGKKGEIGLLGEDGMGFNLMYGDETRINPDDAIRTGIDYMRGCTIGGGHQVDLVLSHDWSDPYVLRGATARLARRALADRTRPNTLGVHIFDEPGLTWMTDAKTGKFGPNNLPPQERSYTAAFDRKMLHFSDLNPDNPDQVAQWTEWARWKLSFLDAANKLSRYEIESVNSKFLSVTQSQYGAIGFTDGYYFNVTRSLSTTSGHGGYDGWGLGYFNPSFFLELARARDRVKDNWYLPTWYSQTDAEYRLEQYLSFMVGIQGMAKPPDFHIYTPNNCKQSPSILETNKSMARLGTIFTTMSSTNTPVAVLYSLSQLIHSQVLAPAQVLYAGDDPHGKYLPFTYLAGQMIQQPFQFVVDEDILDGTLATNYKAVILSSLSYLDPKVIRNLESFAANGGLVLLTGDCTIKIAGGITLAAKPGFPNQEEVDATWKKGRTEGQLATTVGKQYVATMPLALAIKEQLAKAGIKSIFQCNQYDIAAAHQGQGDIEYFFAANAAYDDKKNSWNALRASTASISLATKGRAVYDAMHGGSVPEFARVVENREGAIAATFRFGAGQMRAFAVTARPIFGVEVSTPLLLKNYALSQAPLRVSLSASLVDNKQVRLSGSAPMRIRLLDPLGTVRYDLYRATEEGVLKLMLPLAANDPPGEWIVEVQELLNNTIGRANFNYQPATQCGALAGATQRAVYFDNDREHIFQFFRTHQDVTIVKGASEFNNNAAERLAANLQPWGIRATIITATAANKPRPLTAEEIKTWVNLDKGHKFTADNYGPGDSGFIVQGPVILLGTPEDNALIKFALDRQFLPYIPVPNVFPGKGRGYLAWQRGAVGYGQDSLSAIAYDEIGMSEAIGALFEAAVGLDPLTPLSLPISSDVKPAFMAPEKKMAARIVWQALLPDRALWIKNNPAGQITICTLDNSLITMNSKGVILDRKDATEVEITQLPILETAAVEILKEKLLPRRVVKQVTSQDGMTAIAYWGGSLQLFNQQGNELTRQLLPQDISFLNWCDKLLVVALADGTICGLTTFDINAAAH